MSARDARPPSDLQEQRRIALEAKVLFLEQMVEALSEVVHSQGRELQDALDALERMQVRVRSLRREGSDPPQPQPQPQSHDDVDGDVPHSGAD